MATSTHPTPGFDIIAADDMDLHTDDGILGYNDGDIELDLEPPPSYGPDDDVSIGDAASANDMDAQAPGGDNDDYMVDQEDVIEEDYSYQDVDVDVDVEVDAVAEQSAVTDTTATQAEAEVQDEDLLDYSEEDDDYHDTALRSPWLQQHDSMQDEPGLVQDAPIQQDEPSEIQNGPVQQDEPFETHDAPAQQNEPPQVQDARVQQDAIPADLQALTSTNMNKNSQSPHAHPDVVADGSTKGDNNENPPRARSVDPTEENAQTDSDDGGITLKEQEEHARAESGHNHTEPPSHDHGESAQVNEHEDDDSFQQLPPVTVNCMGEELWLFKQHDYENNGDWLLTDVSVAKTSMSDLFQACRSALGHEVLNGMEIGFRFDHFQNMELFEENTACVAISLERLVGYYHVLREQDGNNDPDSFYVTLLYRPRFATLLADIARYADNGRGYSGLEAAIAAGETNFHSAPLDLPVEENTEWDTEGQEQEQEQEQGQEQELRHGGDGGDSHERNASEQSQEEGSNGQTYEEDSNDAGPVEDANEQSNLENQAPQDVDIQVHAGDQPESEDQNNHDEQAYAAVEPQQDPGQEYSHDDGDDGTQDSVEEGGVGVGENVDAAIENASTGGHEEDDDVDHAPQAPSSSEVSRNSQRVEDYPEQTRSQSDEQTAAELEARRLQEEGDIIDYSDGEDEESAAAEEVGEAAHTEPSPSPATVQGNETCNGERQSPAAGSPSIGQQTNGDEDQGSLDTTNDAEVDAEQDYDTDPNEYWEYNEDLAALEEVDPDESQSDEVQNDTTKFEFDGDANQDYGDYEYQNLEQQAEVELTNGEDVDGDENTATDGDYSTIANEVVDVGNVQWTVDQGLAQDVVETMTRHEEDNVEAQDEEDGVAGQLGSATSSAANPTTASSTDAHDVSLQGRKRSIDEAGHGVDIASDSIDAKRARV